MRIYLYAALAILCFVALPTSALAGSGDLNNDNRVDFFDLFMVLTHAGAGKAYNASVDLNTDGLVNLLDFVLVTKHWGENYSVEANIWVSKSDILLLPTSGSAWNKVLVDAAKIGSEPANISDQDSNHDQYTYAAALACVRVNQYCNEARAAVLAAIGTENYTLTEPRTPSENQWLPVGRNLAAYTISADLLDLRSGVSSEGDQVYAWLSSFPGRYATGGWEFAPFQTGSNANAHMGFVYATVAVYLQDEQMVARSWDAFRTFVCDPGAPDNEPIQKLNYGTVYNWSHNDTNPCAINPPNATRIVPVGLPGAGMIMNIDGAVPSDQRRGGPLQWPPLYTWYPWTGFEGTVPAAIVLQRQGYPAYTAGDNAVARAVEYQWWLGQQLGQDPYCTDGWPNEGGYIGCWWDYDSAEEVKHLFNWIYNKSYPYRAPVGMGRTIGYVDWTHPTSP
jgi:hypothetical protein